MNKKLEIKYTALKDDLLKLEKDTTETINSQIEELAKKQEISKMPELKANLLEEYNLLNDASKLFLDSASKCSKTADTIKTQIKEYEKYEERVDKNKKVISKPNSMLDYQENESNHFAKGNTFYKLFWVFFIGCFAGVAIETIFCIVTRGHYESRVGLIWGPFNLVYGFGALVLSAFLYKYRNRSRIYSFIGGFITGSIVEYLCSYFQELMFGSTSWDYSNFPFNINGRICLLYSLFWGILGILWIKDIYPFMSEMILKIPNKIGKKLTMVLLVFMIVNSLATGAVVFRWKDRLQGAEANNKIVETIDRLYPNERMEKIFANMKFNQTA